MKQWSLALATMFLITVWTGMLLAQEIRSIKTNKKTRSNENVLTSIDQVLSCAGGLHEISFGANNTLCWAMNNGIIAARPNATQYGLEFPRGTGFSLVYAGGFYLGGLKTGATGDTVNVYEVEFQAESIPGRILNSGPFGSLIAEDYLTVPTFMVLPGNEACWPAEAPHNSSGLPLQLSENDTWAVFNDLSDSIVTDPYSLSPGFGIEVQRQTFQFISLWLNDAVMVRMRIINKSDRDYPGFYIGLWNDPDVGIDASTDLSNVDSAISLGYSYSSPGNPDDAKTAYGCLLLQGPLVDNTTGDSAIFTTINENGFTKKVIHNKSILPATSFIGFRNSANEDPNVLQKDLTRYNYLKGLTADGNPKPGGVFDPGTGLISADTRFLLSSGPFTFAAGDTQEIWYAMIGAQGTNNANAVTYLLNNANNIRNDFNPIIDVANQKDIHLNNLTLYQNYPNPFNPSTSIDYALTQNNHVTLKIYNMIGQEVRALVNRFSTAGNYSVNWDGKDRFGKTVSSGIYLYRLQVGNQTVTKKMTLLR